jgi:hypothetical protein
MATPARNGQLRRSSRKTLVLAFCIFEKHGSANIVTSYMHRLKFKHFGHDTVVMHERELRKATRPFDFLLDPIRRAEFMTDLSSSWKSRLSCSWQP